ncbi:MAG: PEP-CTERM sorting domain-containing protein [Myxococcota bacterium]
MVATSNATGLGGAESVEDIRMSKLGGFIQVVGAGADDVQRYELEVTLVPEPARALLTAIAVIAIATIRQRRRRQAAYASARGPV